MYSYLQKHVIDNVWCNNEQDHQYVIAAHKITPTFGVINYTRFMNRDIRLPVQGVRCHLYSIGQLHPRTLGLLSQTPDWTHEQWYTFKDAINNLKLFCNLYIREGLELPRYKSHYLFTQQKTLIIAIEEDSNYPIDFSTDKIYLRLYRNAYFESVRSDATNDYLWCAGNVVTSSAEILDFQTLYNTYAAKPGYVYAYVNGYLVDRIDLLNVSINDTVEFIYDSSVKKVVTLTVRDLLTFHSELDQCYKYLLHHPDTELNDTIDYQDDIDIHILNYRTEDRFEGYYYHRNADNSHRMVTHRDYSISVDYFTYIATELSVALSSGSLDIRDFKLQITIRRAGYQRPLVFDNNRIFELYKLAEDHIVPAMVGIAATVPEWQASQLESSAYAALMRSNHAGITMEAIQQAYGYNALSKLLGDTPRKTQLISGLQTVDLPYGLHQNVTVYEYDSQGYLLGWHHQSTGYQYSTPTPETRLVETIAGRGTNQPEVIFGRDLIAIPTQCNYRVYMCYLVNGLPSEVWEDITGSTLYSVVNNVLTWNNLESGQYLMIRTDRTFLAYDLEVPLTGGLLYFTLAEIEDRESVIDNHRLSIPLGELDIFLNGRSLIRDVDYAVRFPEVYIFSKRHLVQPVASTLQRIHVRFTGFCKADLSMDPIEDRGYIQHGFLSNNNRHDIRDDKVLRITSNGRTLHREDLLFSEQHDGISIVNALNGHPYQIKDIVVPLQGLVNADTYSLRQLSTEVDQRVSDYLTVRLPQPERNAVSAVAELYPVVSPFIARIIFDLINDVILPETIEVVLTDMAVLAICQPYEYLLAVDPVSDQRRLDMDYVIIHPTMLTDEVQVSLHEYRFLMRVLQLYTQGLVTINNFVTITASGV